MGGRAARSWRHLLVVLGVLAGGMALVPAPPPAARLATLARAPVRTNTNVTSVSFIPTLAISRAMDPAVR